MLIGFIQLFLGYLFLNTGIEKARHPGHVYQTVRRLTPSLSSVAKPVGLATILAELAVSACLLIYPLSLIGLLASSLLLSLFTVALTFSLSSDGPAASCGCGPKLSRADGAAVARNVLLIAIAAVGLGLRSFGVNLLTEWPVVIHELFAWAVVLFVVLPHLYFKVEVEKQLRFQLKGIEHLRHIQTEAIEQPSR
ncbi:MAG TPA: MauE/DoxX family redox-associated membrane protein [Dehalococcoidia bacterium]|nr:MauE/DoxX family redox-associated membrane protein [Dehalococcoidia bacterium]